MKVSKSLRISIFVAVIAFVTWIGHRWAEGPVKPEAQTSQSGRGGAPVQIGSVTATKGTDANGKLPAAEGRRMLPYPKWGPAIVPPDGEGVASAARAVLASAVLEPIGFPDFTTLKHGDVVRFPLGGDDDVYGVVGLVTRAADGLVVAGGHLSGGVNGTFQLSQSVQGEHFARILLPDQEIGYELVKDGAQVLLNKKPLDALICFGIPREPGPIPQAASGGPQAIGAIPILNSQPTIPGTLYLDFDGELVTDPDWNGGNTINALPAEVGGSPITTAQMTDVWRRVAEDYRAVRVNVTTDRAVYDSAPLGQRMICVVTPTNDAAPSAGGVAYLGSYRGSSHGFTDTIPCWAFNRSTTAIMAMTISHELGHTVNLRHDGTDIGGVVTTYYSGHDSGTFGWGPIMGAPFSKNVVVFNNGDYPNANNNEDDFAVISKLVGEPLPSPRIGLLADDAGGTPATAGSLGVTGSVTQHGIVGKDTNNTTSSNERDYWLFRSIGGVVNFTVTADTPEPDLDVAAEIRNSSDVLVATAPVSATKFDATISATLPLGDYYLVVYGKGRPASGSTIGYSNYGSVGAYTLTGTWPPLPTVPVFTLEPASATGLEGTAFSLLSNAISNTSVSYRWRKNGNLMPGRTSKNFVFSKLSYLDAGSYVVEAYNSSGSTPSTPAVLTVDHKPVFTQQPAPVKSTLPAHSNLTLTAATLAHPAATTYQWKLNGVNVPSATSDTLVLTDIGWFDAGTYTLVAKNSIGETTSLGAVLVVTSAPLITVQPPAVKPVAVNGTGTVSVTAVGTPPLTYQWFRGANKITGAIRSSFSFVKAQVAMEDLYHVVVTNGSGTATSTDVQLDVQDPPVITMHPVPLPGSLDAATSPSFTFSVAATGTPTLNFQWQRNNIDIPGANASSYTVNGAGWLDAGVYRCVVTNAVGKAISKTATVSVISKPVIITPPIDTKIARKGTGVLRVVAGGTPVLHYQWFKGASLLTGKTGATLSLPNADPATTDGDYSVAVTNVQGTATSSVAHVEVQDVPVITTQPLTQPVAVGGSVTLGTVHTGTPAFTYQWQKNNVNIPGATNATLVLTNAQTATTTGTYRVIIKNAVGTATSIGAKITVQTPPSITKHPVSQTRYEHDRVTLSVTASGSATLKYQWRRNLTNLPATNASAKTATLILPEVLAADAGSYDCVVTNAVGSATSNPAVLTITPVPAPQLSYFAPTKGVPGDRVELQGANLSWAKRVLFNGKAAAFVVKSLSELRVTVPTGATTGQITIETWGGTITTASLTPSVFTVTGVVPQDNFIDARILEGSTIFVSGSTAAATKESFDPNLSVYQGHSIWFRWRVPQAGRWRIDTIGSTFDTVLFAYQRPAPPFPLPVLLPRPTFNTFTAITANQEYSPNGHTARIDWQFTGTEEVWFMLDGDGNPNSTSIWKDKGNYQFRISFLGATAPVADASATVGAPDSAAAVVTEAALATPASVDGEAEGGTIVASTRFTIHPGSDGDERYAISAFNTDGAAAFSVLFDTRDNSISLGAQDGTSTATGQHFVANEPYHIEFRLDYASHLWSATLNDVPLASGMPLPAGTFADLSATWQSLEGKTAGGKMDFTSTSRAE